MISQQDKIDFYNVLYFSNEYECFKLKAICGAFRDFSRTLRYSELKNESELIKSIKISWENELMKIISEVCEKSFIDEDEFDKWHEEKTNSLKIVNKDFKLTIGQSQKWINMTLKYLFLIGDDKIPNISKNCHLFHIPIDNIIQERISNILKINKIKDSWSRIPNYDCYLNYQKEIRNKIKPQSPFEFEFKLFNNKNYQL